MQPDQIDEMNQDFDGPGLPHPGDDVQVAFDEWLDKSSFEWEQAGYPFWSHLHHAQTWWDYRHLDNILMVHFSDLLKDTDGQMRRISAFLDIPVNEEIWPTLVEGVSFKSMKANADKMAPAATHGLWKDNSNFFHKGANQRWRGLITEEQSQRYEAVAAERLTPDLCEWLANGTL